MILLVPNTGIQYAPLPDLELRDLVGHEFTARRGVRFSAFVPYVPGRRAEESVDFEERSFEEAASAESSAGFRTRSMRLTALRRLLERSPKGLWLPLPFEGGAFWVSVHLREVSGKVQVTLAVDTTLESDGNPDGPSMDELGRRVPSPCAPAFWRRPCIERMVEGLVERVLQPAGAEQRAREVVELQFVIAGLADLLRTRGLAVYLESRPEVRSDVVVDMVMDLGNSRTCVLLKERIERGRCQRLSLSYPDQPRTSDASPFPTQIAFDEHEIVPHDNDGTVSFRCLSIAKIGHGAVNTMENATSRFDPRPLGISTPKRYLWEDYDGVSWRWSCANRWDAQGESPAIHGDILRRMDPRRIFREPDIHGLAAPNHPRVACMVWAIVELLEQSFRQVNSPEWRQTHLRPPLSDRRRLIRNLVVTYPAGLHSVELRNFERAAKYACRLWSEFRTSPDAFCSGGTVADDTLHGTPCPSVQMICDEGMAIQLCWLYGESVHRFASDAQRLVNALGRPRSPRAEDGTTEDKKPVPTLRLASIDIGGGTVDLAIADYRVVDGVHELHAQVGFECDQRFHDSISRAGDDIIRGILEERVFPAILQQAGVPTEAWNRFFATAEPPDDEIRKLRRRLVRPIWMPVAMRCLAALESRSVERAIVKIGDVATESGILSEFQDALERACGRRLKVRLEDVAVEITRQQMRGIVRGTIGRTIDQCADIISQFDCDLLVVGGRPSSNPDVIDQIYASMAVPPGQVVFLSETAVDDWYPFANGSGRIGDAKTCGVVGGSFAFEGRYGQGRFVVRFLERPEPTPIIGWLRDLGLGGAPVIPANQVVRFDGDDPDIRFMPMNPLVIACRRVDHPEAEARPIYQVRLNRQLREQLHRSPTLQGAVRVRLELAEESFAERERTSEGALTVGIPARRDRLVLRPGSVQGEIILVGRTGPIPAEDCLELRACTLIESEGYWIDTGVFRQIEGIGT